MGDEELTLEDSTESSPTEVHAKDENPHPILSEDAKSDVENKNISEHVGLERLDKIREDLSLLEGAVDFAEGERKIGLQVRVSQLRDAQREICEKSELNWEDVKDMGLIDEVSISKLLTEIAAQNLPPVKEGDHRMFRGEGPYTREVSDDSLSGRWFSPDLGGTFFNRRIADIPARRMLWVDVARDSLGQYHVDDMEEFKGASKKDEYLLPRDVASQSKELIRFRKIDTTGDPWPKVPPANSNPPIPSD